MPMLMPMQQEGQRLLFSWFIFFLLFRITTSKSNSDRLQQNEASVKLLLQTGSFAKLEWTNNYNKITNCCFSQVLSPESKIWHNEKCKLVVIIEKWLFTEKKRKNQIISPYVFQGIPFRWQSHRFCQNFAKCQPSHPGYSAVRKAGCHWHPKSSRFHA